MWFECYECEQNEISVERSFSSLVKENMLVTLVSLSDWFTLFQVYSSETDFKGSLEFTL